MPVDFCRSRAAARRRDARRLARPLADRSGGGAAGSRRGRPLDSRSAQPERGRRRRAHLGAPVDARVPARHEAHADGNHPHRRGRARARGTAGRRGNAAEAGRDAEGSVGLVGRADDRRAQRRGTARSWRACRAWRERLCRRRPEAPRSPRGRSRARLDDAHAAAGRKNGRGGDRRTAGRQRLGAAPHVAGALRSARGDRRTPRGGPCGAVRRPRPASLREAPGAERSVLRHPVGADRSRRRHQRAAGVGSAAADNAAEHDDRRRRHRDPQACRPREPAASRL